MGSIIKQQALLAKIATKTSLENTKVQEVIQALQAEISDALIHGNSVVLYNFVTFKNGFEGTADKQLIEIPNEKISLVTHAHVSPEFTEQVKSQAQCILAVGKIPVIARVMDMASRNLGEYTPLGLFQIQGEDLKFDPDVAEEGVFLVDSNETEQRVNTYGLVTNSQILAQMPMEVTGTLKLVVRVRYNGKNVVRSREPYPLSNTATLRSSKRE